MLRHRGAGAPLVKSPRRAARLMGSVSLAVLLVACVSCTDQGASTGTGRVSGRVVDAQGLPLPGVTMSLVDSRGDPVIAIGVGVMSDQDGEFSFDKVPPGRFRLGPVDEQERLVRPQVVVVADGGAVRATVRAPRSLSRQDLD